MSVAVSTAPLRRAVESISIETAYKELRPRGGARGAEKKKKRKRKKKRKTAFRAV